MLYKCNEQYSYPLHYLEVNNAIYCKAEYNYTLAYMIDNGKAVKDISTEYGRSKHYYTEQAQ